MQPFDATEYEGMQSTASESMLDLCRIGVAVSGGWGVDPGAAAYEYGSEIPCGFAHAKNEETTYNQAAINHAILRVPIGTAVSASDRIEMTYRHGTPLAEPERYAIEGAPELGASAIVLKLKRIAGNSAR